jgi:hypothetical protein
MKDAIANVRVTSNIEIVRRPLARPSATSEPAGQDATADEAFDR